MYTPEKRLIDSGYANVKFTSPDMDYEGWKEIGRNYLAQQEKKYKETNDLYDLQAQQANDLNAVLEGTTGKDYLYLQESIVNARNELKALYKGKRLRETRTPDFQSKLYNIQQSLSNKKNSINTFHAQAKQANEIAQNTPSIKKKEWSDYLNAQTQLPPDQRDVNLVGRVNTDPLMFNSYNYALDISKAFKESGKKFLTRESPDQIFNYEAVYRPDLGEFDDKGNFVLNPSDELMDRLLKTDPRFRNAMAGMLPPEEAKALIDSGNTAAFNDAVRQQTKKFLGGIRELEPTEKLLKSVTKNWEHWKNSATQDKAKKEEDELKAMQQRLLQADPRSFDDFIGDFWKGFDYEVDEDGKVIGIAATYEKDDPLLKSLGKKIKEQQMIQVDPDDIGSVKQALNIIKLYANRDKKQVTVKPLKKQEKARRGAVDEID